MKRFAVVYHQPYYCEWCGHALNEHGPHPEGIVNPEPGLIWHTCTRCPQSVCVHVENWLGAR